MQTLFEKLGGHQNLTKIVDQFYQHILADDRTNEFFLDRISDISRIHKTTEEFLAQVFGGPKEYKGPDLITIHKNMKIKKEHFDTVWQHMEAAFLYFSVHKDIVPQVKQKVYSLMGFIVNTPS